MYIDIGCYQPKRFSNTYFFYKKGWNGINIDPRLGSQELFNKYRKRDKNIPIGISNHSSFLDYQFFEEPVYSGFFGRERIEKLKGGGIKFLGSKKIEVMPLSDLLKKYLPDEVEEISFMTIDVEGKDLEVLKSNNWNLFVPKFILIEDDDFLINSTSKSAI